MRGASDDNRPDRISCGSASIALPCLKSAGCATLSGVAGREQTDGAVKERADTKRQEPALYKVVLLNDDYTPMDFVVQVLETVFQKSPAEAHRIMMQVHLNGRGIAGVYPWEVADTKVDTVASLAGDAGHPLRATLEEV
jgi:ATP-dependent Clp protease adaptor protein ClpS